MQNNQGWISLHRKILQWEWFTDVNTNHLFIYCLLRANIKPTKWRGIELKRGEFATSLKTISNESGLSIQTIRTSLKKLENSQNLTSKPTNKYRCISIVNYDFYQDNQQATNKQLTNNQQATNKQLTTDNNIINKQDNNIINNIDNLFAKFWLAYPVNKRNKGVKKKAKEKLLVALKKDKFENIMKGVKNYESYIRSTGQANRDAFRWLENESWQDEYTIQQYHNEQANESRQQRIDREQNEAAVRGMLRAENPDF